MDENILYYGDNLDVLRRHVKHESVDLIYLDPPFKSNQDYNVIFAEQDGSRAAAQIKAFEDTWRWDRAAASAYQEIVERGGKVSQAMQAFRLLLGDSDTLAYLAMMALRIVELHRVLRPAGSIYLHCDPTASHYLKLLMDAVFGTRNFRNEIVWKYQKYQKHDMTYFTRNSDRILWYIKDAASGYTFNPQFIELDSPKRYLKRVWDKEKGRIVNAKDESGHVLYMTVERQKLDDVWQIPYLMPASRQRLGYPTQKPESLLERIIKASSNEGDTILDPFCGCGTTIAVAQRLNRRWIGIDITHLAVTLIKHRLRDAFGDAAAYRVVGEPVSVSDAQALAQSDPYQFQWWALGLVGARPVEQKKGADKGIDGRLYFHDEGNGKTKQIILSVKAGHTNVAHVRDLRGVLDRENADIGVLIAMQEPTQPMRTEAAGAGFYTSPWSGQRHPRLQILTVTDLLAGKSIDYPRYAGNVTFKRAPKNNKISDAQASYLPGAD